MDAFIGENIHNIIEYCSKQAIFQAFDCEIEPIGTSPTLFTGALKQGDPDVIKYLLDRGTLQLETVRRIPPDN